MAWHDARAERDRLVNRALLRLEMRGELDRPLVRRIADLNAQLEAMRHLRQWLRERG